MLLAEGLCHAPIGHIAALDPCPSEERGPRALAGLKSWPPYRESSGTRGSPRPTRGGPASIHGGSRPTGGVQTHGSSP